jgi:hypothetical protein
VSYHIIPLGGERCILRGCGMTCEQIAKEKNMADIKLDVKYRMDLNRDEWLVVSKALRAYATGGAQTEHPTSLDRDIAAKLQEQMLNQKASALSQMAQEAERHVDNISSPRRKP